MQWGHCNLQTMSSQDTTNVKRRESQGNCLVFEGFMNFFLSGI